MRLAILREEMADEKRAACSPEILSRYQTLGFEIHLEKDVGARAGWSDDDYKKAGALLSGDGAKILGGADILLCVRPPSQERIGQMKKGALLIGLLNPFDAASLERAAEKAGVSAFALERMPRITRAQSMDALSSQSNLVGYRAVIDAAAHIGRAMPMMMTAAGTVAPARVFVMGAGVAGLQAIATARRLGAIVSATDIRAVAREQVESLGAEFVMVEEEGGGDEVSRETGGGYAREADEDYRKRQAERVSEHLKSQNIVICTALVPGKKAPELLSAAMVRLLPPRAVIMDLAIEQGGNCALSKKGEIVEEKGVSIIAPTDMPSRIAMDASSLYARNLFNFVETLIKKNDDKNHDQEKPALAIPWDDEIVQAIALTREGKILSPSS